MKISDRDKKILYVLLIVILVFCAYFFGYRNITAANEKLESEISANTTTYNNLRIMEAQADQYAEDTEEYLAEYDEIIEGYATDHSQSYILNNLINIEGLNETWISQAGLSESQLIYTFGNITSTNPSKSGVTVYNTDYEGYSTTTTLSYQMSYDNFKKVIDYLNTYEYKYTIDSLSASYNAESDLVSGSMSLTQYAVIGEDRSTSMYVNKNIGGTENIFASSTFTSGDSSNLANGNYVVSDYDFYMYLQDEDPTVANVAIGAKADLTGESLLTSFENKKQKVTVRFFTEDNQYYVQYSIGDVTYPAENYDDGMAFTVGNYLSFLVVSSERYNASDVSGVSVTFINETDMTLDVKVINEDDDDPRFSIVETVGDVNIYF